jgi:predicted DNA binding CopG/RHH family protein
MARAPAQTAKSFVRKVTQKDSKYLLRIPEDLRREIRIEALTKGLDMSNYICDILRKRSR